MLEKLTKNVAIHQTLGDNPNTDGEGMTAQELKEAFDAPAETLKEHINTHIVPYAVDKRGDVLQGDLNAAGNRVTGLPAPASNADAATKGYVDAMRENGIYLKEGVDYFDVLPENVPAGKLVFVKAGA